MERIHLKGIKMQDPRINLLAKNLINYSCALKKGEKVGEITIYKNGVEIGKVDLVSLKDVKKLNFFGYVDEILKAW